MDKQTTAQRLKQIMTERGLKQVDILAKCDPICEKLGLKKIGSNGLSQYVTGKVEPGQKTLSVLAKALDTNEVWLMGFNVPNTPKINYPTNSITTITDILQEKGFLKQNETITEEELNRLIEVAKANKKFIMNDPK